MLRKLAQSPATLLRMGSKSATTRDHYHPDFDRPLASWKDSIIIKTEDGVLFHFSLGQLAQVSSFFDGIRDLQHDPKTAYDLPGSSGAELAVILHIVFHSSHQVVTAGVSTEIVRSVEAASRGTGDAYDFTSFPDLFKSLVRDGKFEDSFAQLALALIINEPGLIKDASSRTLVQNIAGVSPEIRKTLSTRWPTVWLQLQHLHRRHSGLLVKFEKDLHSWPMYNGFDDFGKMCKGTAEKSNGPCMSFSAVQGKFPVLRRLAAVAAMEHIRGNKVDRDGPTAEKELEVALRDVVLCQRCRTRLGRTFAEARVRSRFSPDFNECI